MTSTAPWTVRTTKRKVAMTTPPSGKRRRASLPPGSRAPFRKQQTLTQILPSLSRPVSFNDGELNEIKAESTSRSPARIRRLKKRDSTLTQMGFIGEHVMAVEMPDDDMKPLVTLAPILAAVPQLDGNYDSPRKPRPSKSGLHRKRKSVSLQADEFQENVPAVKRRRGKAETDDKPNGATRRRSARQASKLPSDPAENFALFQEKFADRTTKLKTGVLEIDNLAIVDDDTENFVQPLLDGLVWHGATRQVSEIQDSIESMSDDIESLAVIPVKEIPKTPQKKRRYIPSSQSPESLPPSTKKRYPTSRDEYHPTPKLHPLLELSSNIPNRRPMFDAQSDHKRISAAKAKASALKLPTKSLAPVKTRIEDSQAEIWMVQPTSSTKKGDSLKIPQTAIQNEAIAEEELGEIPSTSQAQSTPSVNSSPPKSANGDTQASLPSLRALFGAKKKSRIDSNDLLPEQASHNPNVKATDFLEQHRGTPQKETQYVCFLDTQPLPNAGALYTDDGSDFGSPLANDTQFAADLQGRILTSPLNTSDHLKNLDPKDTIRISSSSSSEDGAPTSPLPAPKLVDRVEYQNSTTTVPIKDLSSPALPPAAPPSQRPIAPASLPHPSQISTQEPSQQLPQPSSMPQRSPARTDRITIKDSSSMYTPLSQLPVYNEDELQLQRELEQSQHAGPDEDEEDDNDDLDPSSPRKIVRFQEPSREPEHQREQKARREPSPPSQHDNFTQNGHVTATYIEDMRKRGLIPPGYQPPAYQVPPARELLPAWMFEDEDDNE